MKLLYVFLFSPTLAIYNAHSTSFILTRNEYFAYSTGHNRNQYAIFSSSYIILSVLGKTTFLTAPFSNILSTVITISIIIIVRINNLLQCSLCLTLLCRCLNLASDTATYSYKPDTLRHIKTPYFLRLSSRCLVCINMKVAFRVLVGKP